MVDTTAPRRDLRKVLAAGLATLGLAGALAFTWKRLPRASATASPTAPATPDARPMPLSGPELFEYARQRMDREPDLVWSLVHHPRARWAFVAGTDRGKYQVAALRHRWKQPGELLKFAPLVLDAPDAPLDLKHRVHDALLALRIIDFILAAKSSEFEPLAWAAAMGRSFATGGPPSSAESRLTTDLSPYELIHVEPGHENSGQVRGAQVADFVELRSGQPFIEPIFRLNAERRKQGFSIELTLSGEDPSGILWVRVGEPKKGAREGDPEPDMWHFWLTKSRAGPHVQHVPPGIIAKEFPRLRIRYEKLVGAPKEGMRLSPESFALVPLAP